MNADILSVEVVIKALVAWGFELGAICNLLNETYAETFSWDGDSRTKHYQIEMSNENTIAGTMVVWEGTINS